MTISRDNILFLLEKSETSLAAADMLLKSGYPDYCVSRAYYAMFYAAEAVLLTRELQFSKHSAVVAAFAREFVKQGIFDKDMSRQLRRAFQYRMEGDYGLVPVDQGTAEAILKTAGDFVDALSGYLREQGLL